MLISEGLGDAQLFKDICHRPVRPAPLAIPRRPPLPLPCTIFAWPTPGALVWELIGLGPAEGCSLALEPFAGGDSRGCVDCKPSGALAAAEGEWGASCGLLKDPDAVFRTAA